MGGENAASENPFRRYYFLIPSKPNYLIFKFFKIFQKNTLTIENLSARLDAWGGRMPCL
jgi:hypothetical protein